MRRLTDEHWPRATRYTDFREMLEQQKDIDAVLVATPDHIARDDRARRHDRSASTCTCRSRSPGRSTKRARSHEGGGDRVATQMGNQGHSLGRHAPLIECIWAGVIGDVREVHVWTNRPLGYWPQGIPRPAPMTTKPDDLELERCRR